MNSIESVIEAHARKVEQLRSIASDPSLQPLLVEIAKGLLGKIQTTRENVDHSTLPLSDNLSKMTSTEAVKAVILSFDHVRKFTNTEIASILETQGYKFEAQNPSVAVSGILRRLQRAGMIRKVGNRGKAFLFRRVAENSPPEQQGAEPGEV